MPSGGHSRSGPPPDPTSLRSARNGSPGGWVRMEQPPENPPAWPFGVPTDTEAAAWASLWAAPAASLWERFTLVNEAATHVRTSLAFAAGGYSNAALGGLVARQAESLGLTVTGAARNRWSWPAAAANAAPQRPADGPARPAVASGRPSARERFRVIPHDAAPDNYRTPPDLTKENPA